MDSNVITLTTDGFGARLMRFDQTVQIWDAALAVNKGSEGCHHSGMWRTRQSTFTPQIAGVAPTDKIVTAGIHCTCVTSCICSVFPIIIPMQVLEHGWDSVVIYYTRDSCQSSEWW